MLHTTVLRACCMQCQGNMGLLLRWHAVDVKAYLACHACMCLFMGACLSLPLLSLHDCLCVGTIQT